MEEENKDSFDYAGFEREAIEKLKKGLFTELCRVCSINCGSDHQHLSAEQEVRA